MAGSGDPRGPRAWTRADAGVCALLLVLDVAYLASLPHSLGNSDETTYLYEAVRMLRGDVLYADLFEIITPGWMYLMAAVFRVFGASIGIARMTAAALHGVAAALLYLTARRFAVRPVLAALAAFAYIVVAQPAWPIASQHWLGTLLCIALLLACAAARRKGTALSALLPGVAVGALIGVQQARGVFMGAGVFAWLIADDVLRRRWAAAAAPLRLRLGALVAGAAAVGAPLLANNPPTAGIEPVWRGLVIHPIFNYGVQGQPAWGAVNVLTHWDATFTFPLLLKALPAILPLCAARLAWSWWRRGDAAQARDLALLLSLCATSMASIAYFPDFIHIAFISPLFLVAIAESLEWGVRVLPIAPRAARRGLAVAALLALVARGARLADNRQRLREHFRYPRDTAFGRVDFGNPREAELYDALRARLDAAARREIFTYPGFLSLYLTLDARNPTRYQFFLPGYSSADQVQSVIDDLAASRVPYIVVIAPGMLPANDPVWAFIQRHYAPVQDAGEVGRAIYRRIASAGAAHPDGPPPAS